jgi:putative transcriptional regulator
MSKKRKLFDELIESVESMRDLREGKTTLRTHEIDELPPLEIDAT